MLVVSKSSLCDISETILTNLKTTTEWCRLARATSNDDGEPSPSRIIGPNNGKTSPRRPKISFSLNSVMIYHNFNEKQDVCLNLRVFVVKKNIESSTLDRIYVQHPHSEDIFGCKTHYWDVGDAPNLYPKSCSSSSSSPNKTGPRGVWYIFFGCKIK